MGNGLIASLVAISGGTWIFTKMQRKTGNNTQSAAIVAVSAAVVLFVVSLILLGFIPDTN